MACYDPLLGAVSISPLNFAPSHYAFCDGSLMAISQNCALFSLLGTNYGGNGITTYGLPDFRGRTPFGAYPDSYTPPPSGTDIYLPGDVGGNASVTPQAALAEKPQAADPTMLCLKPDQIQTLPPYLVLNFIIALWGIFPSRS